MKNLEIKYLKTLEKLLVKEREFGALKEKERIKSKVGILRQYLNEKENDYFITDEEILTLLN